MANTLRFKRGLVSTIPTALAGEPLFTTDTFDLYIGNGTGNTRFQKYIASGTTSQLLRGDGSLLTMPIVLTSPANGQVLKFNGTNWVNDSDAGITGSGANGQVAYFTGATTQTGSNNLFWDASNNRLGIGTNSPASTLDVSRAFTNTGLSGLLSNPILTITNPANWGYPTGIVFRTPMTNGGALTNIGSIWCDWQSDNNTYLGFATNTSGTVSEKMRIFATGNVAINSTTDSGQRLQVAGTSLFTGASTFNSTITASSFIRSGGTSTQYLMADGSTSTLTNPVTGTGVSGQVAYWSGTNTQTGSNNLFWNNTNGNLGIGTNTPNGTGWDEGSCVLHLFRNTTSGGLIKLESSNTAAILNAGNNQLAIFTTTDDPIRIGTNGSERVRIDASGNLLVGSTSAIFSAAGRGNININGTSNAILSLGINANASTGGYLYYDGSNLNLLNNTTTGSLTFSTIGNERARIFPNGNFGINTGTTDSGQRLQVIGDTLLRGSGNTSATTALTVQNSASSTMMSLSNDAANTTLNISGSTYSIFQANQTTANRNVYFGTASTNAEFGCGTAITNYQFLNAGGFGLMRINTTPLPTTGGNLVEIPRAGAPFQPTSGSATFTTLSMQPTINQTGGANGITRGLFVNPTLTAAADWRSIEWSNNTGWGLRGEGTANNYLAGSLGIGATSLTGYGLNVGKNITGSIISAGIWQNGSVLSDVSTLAIGIYNLLRIPASTAISSYQHFRAESAAFGAGATLGTQIGFMAENSLTSATNNFGFYGNIASGTGRWNFYANGTALNYFNGNTIMGTLAADSGEKLQVNGTMKVTGASTFTSTAQAAGFITSGGAGYAVINSAATTVTALRPTGGGTNIMSTNSNGLHIAVGTQATGDLILATNNTERIRLSSNGFFSQVNGTNPSSSITDSYIQYSADIVAGNAAPHFRTENGAVIKLYQQDNSVAAANFVAGIGTSVTTLDAFDGYTIGQVVKALRNAGILL